jgi:hypothetical protein
MAVLLEETVDDAAIVAAARGGQGLVLRGAVVADCEGSERSRRGGGPVLNLPWRIVHLRGIGSHEFARPRQARKGAAFAASSKVVSHTPQAITERVHILQPDYITSAHELAFSQSPS